MVCIFPVFYISNAHTSVLCSIFVSMCVTHILEHIFIPLFRNKEFRLKYHEGDSSLYPFASDWHKLMRWIKPKALCVCTLLGIYVHSSLCLLWIGQKVNPMLTRGLDVHHTMAWRLKEHINNSASYHIRARLHAAITIHVSSNCSLIRSRISRRRLFSCTPI